MHKQDFALVMSARQFANEVPTLVRFLNSVSRAFKLSTSPEDCSQSNRVETFRIKDGRLIMVSKNRRLAIAHYCVKTSQRIRPVADHVAQTDDLVDSLVFYMRQYRRQSLKVRVDVADNSPSTGWHLVASNYKGGPAKESLASLLY